METKEQCEARTLRENIERIESKEFNDLCDKEVVEIIENKDISSQKQFVRIAEIVEVLQKRQHYNKWYEKVAQNLFYRDLFKNIDDDDLMEVKVSFRKNNTQERLFIARSRGQQDLMREVLTQCGAGRFKVIVEPQPCIRTNWR
jgi:hypothetical protein